MKNKLIKNNNYSKKENIIIFMIIFFICIIVTNKYLYAHYTIDTYIAITNGFKSYGTYAILSLGRLNSALYFYLLNLINLNHSNVTIISSLLSMIIASISIKAIYNCFIHYFNNKIINKFLILLLSIISILNPLTMELFAYIESPTMWIGILCSIIAAKIFTSNNKHKYLYSQLFAIISIFSYQPTIGVFTTLSLFLLFLKNNNIKNNLKAIIICFLQYIAAALSNILFIYVVTLKIFDIGIYKLSINYSIIGFIKNITYYFNLFFVEGLGYAPRYIFITIIFSILLILFIILLLKKESFKYIFNYFLIVIFSCVFAFLPLLSIDSANLYSGSRFYISAIIIIPFSIIYILYFCENLKYIKIIITIIISTILVLNSMLCMLMISQLIQINNDEKKDSLFIVNKINQYQNKTNIPIKYIKIFYDTQLLHSTDTRESSSKEIFPFIISNNTMYNSVYFTYVIYTYGKTKLEIINDSSNVFLEKFKGKNWNSLNDENVIIENETIYVCLY